MFIVNDILEIELDLRIVLKSRKLERPQSTLVARRFGFIIRHDVIHHRKEVNFQLLQNTHKKEETNHGICLDDFPLSLDSPDLIPTKYLQFHVKNLVSRKILDINDDAKSHNQCFLIPYLRTF
ncbi:hypothetical protein TNIN_80631 [Trichonephila inaurata madagascariensis]|uniref:Uncharacterized protein n=1 Tax=Trichonephila inaurata madagascariensis TaxID=2747483 RepID=A0A8X6YTV6_9ARAC|nr:hypothetical protein TNIN_80631 [Trichonephila inaurata madagascariensis]